MKIIDLLNKIANGEKPIKARIRYYDKNNDYEDECNFEYRDIIYRLYYGNIDLYDTIEIIEDTPKEEKKIPEKIEYYDDSIAWVIDGVGQLSDVNKVIIDKLNNVIDYLKSKGDE